MVKRLPLSERLVRVYADSTGKRFYLLTFLTCISIFLAMFFVAGFAVPDPYLEFEPVDILCPVDSAGYEGSCQDLVLWETNRWRSKVEGLTPYNAFLAVGATPLRAKNDTLDEIRPLDQNGKELLDENGSEVVIKNEDKVRIVCPEGLHFCNDNLFLLYPQITAPGFKFIITLLLEPNHNLILEEMSFFIYFANPSYTTYLLALRYTLLAISIISFAVYIFYYARSPFELRTFEHRFILILSIALILFNDPFYALTILKSNSFWAVISTLFVTTFVSLLIFFWITMVRRIHIEPASVQTNLINPYTVSIAILFFIVITVPALLASLYSRFNPSIHFNAEYPTAYSVFIIFNLVFAILLLVMFFYNIYQVSKKWNLTIPRHRFFLVFSFYFIMVMFFLIASGIYQSYESEGVKILFLFVTSNVYVFFMQLMWIFNRSSEFYKDVENDVKLTTQGQGTNERRGLNYFDNNLEVNVSRSQNMTANSSFNQMGLAMNNENVAFIKSDRDAPEGYGVGKDGRITIRPESHSLNSSQITNEEITEIKPDNVVVQNPLPMNGRATGLREVKSDGENEFEFHDEEDIKNEYNQFDQEGEELNDENQADFDLFQKYRDYDSNNNNNRKGN